MNSPHDHPAYRQPVLNQLFAIIADITPDIMNALRKLPEGSAATTVKVVLPFTYGDMVHELIIEFRRNAEQPDVYDVALTATDNPQAFRSDGMVQMVNTALAGMPGFRAGHVHRSDGNKLTFYVDAAK